MWRHFPVEEISAQTVPAKADINKKDELSGLVNTDLQLVADELHAWINVIVNVKTLRVS